MPGNLDFDDLKSKQAIASEVLQQIDNLHLLRGCTYHTSCFNNVYIHLSASLKNSSNVLKTLDFDASKTQQLIASGGCVPRPPAS